MGFMVFKSTGLDSRFQRKNWFWKMGTESQDITKKVSKIGLPNQTRNIWHFLANISGLGAYFSKTILALILSVVLNTMNPIIRANFFPFIKGSEPICWPFLHWKMAQIWFFESGSLFSIKIHIKKFLLSGISFPNFCAFHYALLYIRLIGLTHLS